MAEKTSTELERSAARRAARKQKRAQQQRNLTAFVGGIVLLLALGVGAWYFFFREPVSETASSATAPTVAASATDLAFADNEAGLLQPQQRSDMYKSPPAMQIDAKKSYRATIETSRGNIVVDLFAKDAPQHVNNFVFLAREGFFNNLTFHRYEPGFVIQGGDPLGTGTGGPGYNIPAEIGNKHTKGALAMARQSDQVNPTRQSSGSQFYITLEATPFLDGAYSVFGQTTEDSFPVVEKIRKSDTINRITIEEK